MSDSSHDEVEIRPARSAWALVILAGLTGIGFVSMPHWAAAPPHHADDPAMAWAAGALGSAIVACGLVGGLWILRARVQANDTGVRWRSWGRWLAIPWDSIGDFFEEPGRYGRTCVIEARAGRLRLGPCWEVNEDFKSQVARRATRSACHTWGLKGARLDERWPVEFDYDSTRAQSLRLLSCFIVVGLVTLIASGFDLHLRTDPAGPEFGWRLAFTIIRLAPTVLLSLLLLVVARPAWNARRRQADRITVSPESIRFEDDRRLISASWQDVTCIRRTAAMSVGGRWTVHTSRGDFEFSPMLRGYSALGVLLNRFAPHAIEAGLRSGKDGESLAAAPQPDLNGKVEFTYRTRTNRALMGFLAFFALVLLTVPGMLRHPPTSAGMCTPIAMGMTLLVALAWSYWRYRAARVVLDQKGIHYEGPFGRRSMAWGDIAEVRTRDHDGSVSPVYTISSATETLRFPQNFAHEALFRLELISRAPWAVADYH